jgi:hypothetical protein
LARAFDSRGFTEAAGLVQTVAQRNLLNLRCFRENAKKLAEKRKKLLRLFAVIRKYPFTGGAEAPTGRQTGGRAEARRLRGGQDLRQIGRGAPYKLGRISVDFVSRSLTLLVSEEICGRFGSFR